MSGRKMGLGLLLLLALLFSLASAAMVSAAPPDREPLEDDDVIVISGVCDFDVRLEDLFETGAFTTYYDRMGNPHFFLITGALRVRLTNLESGGSMDLNISGPSRQELLEDGSIRLAAVGPWLWWRVPGVPELQSLVLTKGRLDVRFDGVTVEVLSWAGEVQDLCLVLADL